MSNTVFQNADELKRLSPWKDRGTVVFMSDFGTVDGAVSAMHGVADEVCHSLRLEDLTHEIPQFNIWEGSYRLIQTIPYWAPGTVFVCVIDPGVGSDRESVAVLTKSGHIVVTPDNGTLSHISKGIGILERRRISEVTNRLHDSQKSYTFYGRDVYAYTGARLASGIIDFDEVGPLLDSDVKMLDIKDPVLEDGAVTGTVDILDTRYGSLWTNISDVDFAKCGFSYGDKVRVDIRYQERTVYGCVIPFCTNFTEVGVGHELIYINSLLKVSLAVNQGSFSSRFSIGTGEGWTIRLCKA